MIDRVTKEGHAFLLDKEGVMELIRKLDGKTGTDYNWESVTKGVEVVWIPADEEQGGTYVALCDCD